ncbi:hypothetical protein CMV_026274 [Castanea mollissima]|uniref:Uncharacterized protein n=1 Tax=Castanea mollissima TaxID=60419 RepID=A0A8J4QBF6_9ROSI|nr:hypothetical protein CMV_026274 [Castanea mollissima]
MKKAEAGSNKKGAPVVNTEKLDEAAEPMELDRVSTGMKQLIQKARLELSLDLLCFGRGGGYGITSTLMTFFSASSLSCILEKNIIKDEQRGIRSEGTIDRGHEKQADSKLPAATSE